MIAIKEQIIINKNPKNVFSFLTHIDSLYKVWHRKDHVFCKTISGTLSKKGCVFHFLEIIGGFPLYLVVKVTHLENNRDIVYKPIFPFSLLNLGWGYFRIDSITPNQSKLTAFVEYGFKTARLDKIMSFFVKTSEIKKHIKEEGSYMKKYLEKHI